MDSPQRYGSYFGDSGSARLPASPVPARIAGRYELGTHLGAGSHGTVYKAFDLLERTTVAVKLLEPGAAAARVRREAVAMRGLRIPGAVQLLDEGVAEGRPFLVMDFVEGTHFPGVSFPVRWPRLRTVALALFEVLDRVHLAGAMHLDLKPANVFVGSDGSVVLLDLGLAGGPALGGAAPDLCWGGTERYMAPEQRQSGEVNARSDLYAAGVMLFEALTGELPVGIQSIDEYLYKTEACTPTSIIALISSLLSRDPAKRPDSAWHVIHAIDANRKRVRMLGELGTPLTRATLETLFHGPEKLLHLPSDAARVLYQGTEGDPTRIEARLQNWLRRGFAIRHGTKLHIQRVSIERLEQELDSNLSYTDEFTIVTDEFGHFDENKLTTWLASSYQTDFSRMAVLLAQGLLDQQRPHRARRVLQHALFSIRHNSFSDEHEAALLSLWAQMAIDRRNPRGIEIALYEVGRVRNRTAVLCAIEVLLRAALHAEQRESDRAAALMLTLSPFQDLELEIRRYAVRLRIASMQSTQEEAKILQEARRWASKHDNPRIDTRIASWEGRLLYRQGDFSRSAERHAESVTSAVRRIERLSGLLNGASAYMEAGRYEAARTFAGDALIQSRRYRLPLDEGRAEWILRAVAYRSGGKMLPNVELLSAAEAVGIPYLSGLIGLTESAVAWRNTDWSLGQTLSQRTLRHFKAANHRGGVLCAQTLILICTERAGDDVVTAGDIDKIAHDVKKRPIMDIDWQLVALLARLQRGTHWRSDALNMACHASDHTRRRELISPIECIEWINGIPAGHDRAPHSARGVYAAKQKL